ncbi:hypothetical protein OnM2_026090 [Erysiphe neolycopersici]|uniref:Uncharacterized protein n=1 Tax=Erysiphe neolycopersici TaxID=212602 RepID=A0A420I0Q7_9PEZI|nr:hypothetical protein OnM2_026090 [Erysiphe neolycopersici]
MRISCFSILLKLLLGSSVISAVHFKSLALPKPVPEEIRIDVICDHSTYTHSELRVTALKVCNQLGINTGCLNFAGPLCKNPQIYVGKLFPKYKDRSKLFEKRLKISIDQDKGNFERKKCYTIGVLIRENRFNEIECRGLRSY